MARTWAVAVLAAMMASGAAPAVATGGGAVVVVVAPWRYSPNPIELNQGDRLTLANFDTISGAGEGHSVTQAVKPGQELFHSPITPPGTSSAVIGVDKLQKGQYRFTCRVHAFMRGTLVVR